MTQNRYAYCINNPLKYIDPLGLWGSDWIEGIGGGIIIDPYWKLAYLNLITSLSDSYHSDVPSFDPTLFLEPLSLVS